MSLLPTIGAVDQDTGFYDFEIENSLLFNGSGGLRISSGEANTSYWTLSVWVKRHKFGGNYSTIMSATNYGGTYSTDVIGFGSANTMYSIRGSNANGFTGSSGTAVVRDSTAWYHYCLRNNNGTVTRWLNGVQDSTYSVSGTFVGIGRSGNHDIGAYGGSSESYNNNFSLAEFYFINDSGFNNDNNYDYSQFAEFKNGVLVPKENSLTAAQIGDGGWYYEFKQTGDNADSSGVGADSSGNNHHASILGTVSAHCRATIDTPTNNFCTMNSIANGRGNASSFSEGNLKIASTTGAYSFNTSTFRVSSGKWYWEMMANDANAKHCIGISGHESINTTSALGDGSTEEYSYTAIGQIRATSAASGLTTYGNEDIIGVAMNLEDNELQFFKNGSSITTISITAPSGTTDGGYGPAYGDFAGDNTGTATLNCGQDPSFAGVLTGGDVGTETPSSGAGVFKYDPPSGFLALCTANLPEPTIGPNSATQATDHFNTFLYTGTNAANRNLALNTFTPDWAWLKSRNGADNHVLIDSSRVTTAAHLNASAVYPNLHANTTDDEESDAHPKIITNGIQVSQGLYDNNNVTFAVWNWKANGGTTATNNDGDGTSTVQANTTAGFSIVTYTGSTNETYGHGLSQAPEMIWVKGRNVAHSWAVYHKQLDLIDDDTFVELNTDTTRQEGSNPRFLNGTTGDSIPTNTVFKVNNYSGSTTNATNNSDTYVAYCFHPVEGYSKMGFYSGNGETDGPFCFTGFKPAWIIIKRVDTTENWWIYDNKRDSDNPLIAILYADLPNTEVTGTGDNIALDFVSNGVKFRTDNVNWNASGGQYIYMAFAEAPFKYANAR